MNYWSEQSELIIWADWCEVRLQLKVQRPEWVEADEKKNLWRGFGGGRWRCGSWLLGTERYKRPRGKIPLFVTFQSRGKFISPSELNSKFTIFLLLFVQNFYVFDFQNWFQFNCILASSPTYAWIIVLGWTIEAYLSRWFTLLCLLIYL